MTKKLLFLISVFALFWGCTKLDPKIATPAYLQIDDYMVITDSQSQGTNNQKFTDVLITSKTDNYGYYPVPGKIPLPLTGNTYLSIRPAIKVNGVGYLRVDYPEMKGSDTMISLTGGQTTKFKPVFKYFPTVKFRFLENFENWAVTSIINSNPTDTFCLKSDYTQHYNGSTRCLVMRIDGSHPVCQAQSYQAFTLPTTGPYVYLELNYKCNTDFEVGIIGTSYPAGPNSDQRSIGGATASAAWNKIYFNLTDLLRTPPNYPYYYIYFYKGNYDPSSTTNEIYIDNIKVVSQN